MQGAAMTAVENRCYRICGLTVSAGLELPGAVRVEEPVGVPDVIVARGAVPETLSDATRRGPTWDSAPGRLLLRAPGVARFLIREGREILFEPAPGLGDADLAIFVMSSALGALLHQRGCFALHASAVSVGGEAAVFCGCSGVGKSALVGALSAAGYALVSDDVCRILVEGRRPMVVPDGRRLKLWSDTVRRLSLEDRRGAAVRSGVEKYWVDPPTPACREPLPLRSIYFLHESRLPEAAGIQAVSFLDAVATLRAHAYRRRLIRAFGQEQKWLEGSVVVARNAPAWHLTHDLRSPTPADEVHLLEEHWRR